MAFDYKKANPKTPFQDEIKSTFQERGFYPRVDIKRKKMFKHLLVIDR